MMSKHKINFMVEFNISIKTIPSADNDGVWYEATCSNGDNCNSNTEQDCIRILTERAKNRAGI